MAIYRPRADHDRVQPDQETAARANKGYATAKNGVVTSPTIRLSLRSHGWHEGLGMTPEGQFPGRRCRGLLAVTIAVMLLAAGVRADAAELHGVDMPETQKLAGTQLHLNGIAVRTYSWLRVNIYVAGLYLERATHDAEQILRSNDRKLLRVRFLHDVDADQAREAWREGFENNCRPPCRLAADDIARFLRNVPAMRAGDETLLAFDPGGLEIVTNGRRIGLISDRMFATAVLATFIGPEPPTAQLKAGLLGVEK